MVQLVVFLLVVAALVILVLQNLSPVLSLVVLGSSVGMLPFSVWLLGAIAIGVLCTLIIYQLTPQRRAYRPIGKRLSEPTPEPTRFVDTPGREPTSRHQPSDSSERQNPYDSEWETFKAPEQWDDWGPQQPSPRVTSYQESPGTVVGDSVGDAFRDIESGWGDDDYETSARYASRQEPGSDIGWDKDNAYSSQSAEQPESTYEARTYEEGWLYGNDALDDPSSTAEPDEPQLEDSEDVYDANYRVIIPPYDANDKDG